MVLVIKWCGVSELRFFRTSRFCKVQLVVQPLASRLSRPKHYTEFVLPTGCQINCCVYHKLSFTLSSQSSDLAVNVALRPTILVFVVSFSVLQSSCQAFLNHDTHRLASFHYDTGIFTTGISSRSSCFTVGLSIQTSFGRFLLDSQTRSRRRLICRGTGRRQTT